MTGRTEDKPRAGSFADLRRGSRHARGYGKEWVRLRARILKRDKEICRCAECVQSGIVKPATEVDHVVPKYLGGTDDPKNLQAINKYCHRRKTISEALAAQGITERKPEASCAASGLPTDPAHPWNMQGRGGR